MAEPANRSELKESNISSVMSTNIYLLINRHLQRTGKSVFKLSFTTTGEYFS